jgi:hypothetical protein
MFSENNGAVVSDDAPKDDNNGWWGKNVALTISNNDANGLGYYAKGMGSHSVSNNVWPTPTQNAADGILYKTHEVKCIIEGRKLRAWARNETGDWNEAIWSTPNSSTSTGEFVRFPPSVSKWYLGLIDSDSTTSTFSQTISVRRLT